MEELFNSSRGLQSLEDKRNRSTQELKWGYVKEIEQVNNTSLCLCVHVHACMHVRVCMCVRV